MTDKERKALAERWVSGLPRDQFEHVLAIVTPLRDQIEADGQRIAELEAFQQQAIKQVGELAREAGEAKGKLEASELPGIVDGWRDKCGQLESRIAELEAALRKYEVMHTSIDARAALGEQT